MTETYTNNDLLTASEFAKKHGLDIDDVKLAITKLEGLMMEPAKDSQRKAKKPVIVRIGTKRTQPRVNYGAEKIVLAKVLSLQNNRK